MNCYTDISRLSGFSGCDVFFARNEAGIKVVVKRSESRVYNDRLKKQLSKQMEFNAAFGAITGVRSPLIYRTYYSTEGLLTGEMEYVESAFGNDFIDVDKYVRSIDEYLACASGKTRITELPFTLALSQKVESFCYNPHLSELFNATYKLIDDTDFLPTYCHGDFTLENMILANNGILYFIDFLDSFYDHFWLDISKLYQIIEADWLNIKRRVFAESPKSEYKKLRIGLTELVTAKYPKYCKYHYLLLGLHLFRILPYTNDFIIKHALERKTADYLSRFIKNEELRLKNENHSSLCGKIIPLSKHASEMDAECPKR